MRALALCALLVACGGAAPEKCPEPEPVIAKDCAVLDENDQLVYVDCAGLPKE